jgi:uncharacterized repeat protein (TIGR01451 family)
MRFSLFVSILIVWCASTTRSMAQFSLPIEIVGENSHAHAVGDVDGDGWADLIGLDKWWRNQGDGTFAAPMQTITDSGVIPPVMLDVNTDGLPDLVVALTNGQIRYHRNLGGAFTTSSTLIGNWKNASANPNEELPERIELVDINNDGIRDLIVTFSYSVGIWAYNGNASGGFGTRRTIQNGLIYLVDFVFADFNGDGFPDLVYSVDNSGYDEMVIKMNQGVAAGTFGAPIVLNNQQQQAQHMEARDVNNDGILDLVYTKATSGQLVCRPGNGDGTFNLEQVLIPDIPVGAVPSRIYLELIDVDGDGIEDAFMHHLLLRTVSYYPGLGGYTYGPQIIIFQSLAQMGNVVSRDLNNDGILDVLTYGRLSIAHLSEVDTLNWKRELISHMAGGSTIQVGDVDQDGDDDLIVTYREGDGAIVWHPSEDGAFLGRRLVALGGGIPQFMRVADFDGDGLLDVIYTVNPSSNLSSLYWVRNIGEGAFSEPILLRSTYCYFNLLIGDLDNDGYPEVITISSPSSIAPASLSIFRNNGGGILTNIPAPDFTGISELNDVNGDGFLDLCGVANGFKWYRNNGDLTFTVRPTVGSSGTRPQLIDIDDDGVLDVVLGGATVNWFRGLGAGSFSTGQPLFNTSNYLLGQVDVDGDGLVDLLFGGEDTGLFWYKNAPDATIDPNPQTVTSGIYYPFEDSNTLGITDIDGNGRPDFIFRQLISITNPVFQSIFILNYSGEAMLSGRCYVDLDLDGEFGVSDLPAPWLPVNVSPTPSVPHTTSNGTYQYQASAGNYTVSLGAAWPTPLWNVTAGASGYVVEVLGAPIPDLDFILAPAVDSSLVEVSVVLGTAPCSAHNALWLSLRNMGTRIESGTVSLKLDSLFEFIGSGASPISILGDSISWSFDSLGYFQVHTIPVTVRMPSVDHIGMQYTMTGWARTEDVSGAQTGDFNGLYSDVVSCAYDPNDKQVEPAGFGQYGAIDVGTEELFYTIRFQNTGTAPAFVVELRDLLPDLIDPQRLTIASFSHTPSAFFVNEQNELVIRFDGIMLPDSASDPVGSQGFVRFGATLANGAHLNVVENTAGIYFDLNPPIITNTTLTTLVDCDQWIPVASLNGDGNILASDGITFRWYLNGSEFTSSTEPMLEPITPGTYFAVVTSVHGCEAATNEVQVITVGGLELNRGSVAVLPNPFNRSILVRTAGGESIRTAVIVDRSGREVVQVPGAGPELNIDRNGLASGYYFLRITTMDGSIMVLPIIAE